MSNCEKCGCHLSPAAERCDCEEEPDDELEDAPDAPVMASHMTLRDYFAGCALMGMAAHPELGSSSDATDDKLAEWAYDAADAMMAERESR